MLRRLAAAVVALAVVAAVLALSAPTAAAQMAPASSSSPATIPGDRVGVSPGASILNLNATQLDRELALLAGTDARWLRLDIPWPTVQNGGPESFDWSNTDRIVAAARRHGLQVLALPGYTPPWAELSDGNPDPAAFRRFVQAGAQRYASQGVTHWELWNEPNLQPFWGRPVDAAAYTRILVEGAAGVRAGNPSAVVLSAGLAPAVDRADRSTVSPHTFLRDMYRHGAAGSFDIFASHPYSFPALPSDVTTREWNQFQRLDLIRQIMTENGDRDVPVWITEYGAPNGTGDSAITEAAQVDMLRDTFRMIQANRWIENIFWYSLRDSGTDPRDREQNFGMLRHDYSEKPVFAAFDSAVVPAGSAPSTGGGAGGGGSGGGGGGGTGDGGGIGAGIVNLVWQLAGGIVDRVVVVQDAAGNVVSPTGVDETGSTFEGLAPGPYTVTAGERSPVERGATTGGASSVYERSTVVVAAGRELTLCLPRPGTGGRC